MDKGSHDAKMTPGRQLQFEILIEGKLVAGGASGSNESQTKWIRTNALSIARSGMNEQEGDVPVEPIHLMHFFDSFEASVYTMWQQQSASRDRNMNGMGNARCLEPASRHLWGSGPLEAAMARTIPC